MRTRSILPEKRDGKAVQFKDRTQPLEKEIQTALLEQSYLTYAGPIYF